MAKVNCVLNDRFLAARATPHFRELTRKTRQIGWNGNHWYSQNIWLVNKETNENILNLSRINLDGNTQCCGIDELDFRLLGEKNKGFDDDISSENLLYKNSYFDEILAKIIMLQCTQKDQRVLIVGVPTSVGNDSSYNLEAYEKILKTLKSFGFKELCSKPYKNKNSGNFITVLAGQMPE